MTSTSTTTVVPFLVVALGLGFGVGVAVGYTLGETETPPPAIDRPIEGEAVWPAVARVAGRWCVVVRQEGWDDGSDEGRDAAYEELKDRLMFDAGAGGGHSLHEQGHGWREVEEAASCVPIGS